MTMQNESVSNLAIFVLKLQHKATPTDSTFAPEIKRREVVPTIN